MRFAGIVAPDDAVLGVQDRNAVRKRAACLTGARKRVCELAAPRGLGTLPAVQQREHFLPDAPTFRNGLGERARGPLTEQAEVPDVVDEESDESQRK